MPLKIHLLSLPIRCGVTGSTLFLLQHSPGQQAVQVSKLRIKAGPEEGPGARGRGEKAGVVKNNFPSTLLLNSSGWTSNQVNMRQTDKRNDQIYYICTHGPSIKT